MINSADLSFLWRSTRLRISFVPHQGTLAQPGFEMPEKFPQLLTKWSTPFTSGKGYGKTQSEMRLIR